MKKLISLAILSIACASYTHAQNPKASKPQAKKANVQKFNEPMLTHISQLAIERAYPASVRIYAFDTIKKQQASAQFSGVVVTAEGHILTAAHVNTPNQTYLVTFPGGKSAIAQGLGKIEFKENRTKPDVAMMKIITKGNWPYAKMGWSGNIKVNEPVISIAYPESLNQMLPLTRFGSITNPLNEHGFLQSTCMMEPGDSGGPLFDYLGRVIGLHSAINVDVDYEVPVDLYRKYWNALNKPVVYITWPTDQENAGTKANGTQDQVNILTVPELQNLNANFTKTATQYAKTVLEILSMADGKQQKVLGTVIKTDRGNYIVGKSSMVAGDPSTPVNSSKEALKVIKRDKENDLVLLQAINPAILKTGIAMNVFQKDTINISQLGKFLISPQPDNNNTQASVLGSMNFTLFKMNSMAFLGAAVAYAQPVALTMVQPGSPAAEQKLQVGDQVVSINKNAVKIPEDYGKELIKYWPGDSIQFEINRAGELITKNIVLGSRPERPATHAADMFKGGKSSRRDGFATVFAHNALITPEQCGGPVFDTKNNFYGINIARYSRAATIAIPAKTIKTFIETAIKETQPL